MPSIYTASFRVRSYECDWYGHVNNAVYLRYLQEAATGALAAAGFPPARLLEMGLQLWAPRIDIEYLDPLYYGEAVEVTTRATTMGNQAYEVRKAGSGVLAARAAAIHQFSNSSLIGPLDGREPGVPLELAAVLSPSGEPNAAGQLDPFPAASPAPAGIFRTRREIAWQDCNAARQVEPAVLLGLIDDCGRQVIAAHAWPMERMQAEGFAVFIRRNQIEYPQPVIIGDEIEISTWASGVRRATAVRHYTVVRVRDGEILARVHALGVWINLRTGQPMHIPPGFMDDFAPNLSGE
jgi:YbgC/YbaW family acyl-CoA thioester hydrolase